MITREASVCNVNPQLQTSYLPSARVSNSLPSVFPRALGKHNLCSVAPEKHLANSKHLAKMNVFCHLQIVCSRSDRCWAIELGISKLTRDHQAITVGMNGDHQSKLVSRYFLPAFNEGLDWSPS